MSQAGKLINGFVPPPPGTFVETLTGNSGGAVGPDGSDNINVVGDGTTIDVTGNPGTNTLTISAIGSSGISTIDGDTGSVTGSTVTFQTNIAAPNANGTMNFSGAGTVMTLNVNDIFGNIGIGTGCFSNANPGNSGVALGNSALRFQSVGANGNCAIGNGSLSNVGNGNNNVSIGSGSGTAITNTSGNIYINDSGVLGDSHILRIATSATGTDSPLSGCYIGGIDGVDVGSTATVVTESGDRLGTAVITAGSGITVTPGANTITIAASGGSGISTINGDSGSVTGSTVTFNAQSQAGSSVSFSGSGTTMSFNTTDANNNTIIGLNAGNNTLTSQFCTGLGRLALSSLTSAINCTAMGNQSLAAITSGVSNTGIGSNTLQQLTTGTLNTAFGIAAGFNYTGESNNICINNQGTLGDSNTLRIGAGTGTGTQQLNKAFISGIDGVNVGSTATVVTESGDQLGTAVITAGSGITVTPGANTITISASGGGGGGALALIQTQTVSGVTNIDFSTGITSTYNNYRLQFTNVTIPAASVSTTNLLIQISTDGGSTYITTNYVSANSGFAASTPWTTSATDAIGSGWVELFNLTSGSDYITFSPYPNNIQISPSGPGVSNMNGALDAYDVISTTANALRITTSDGSLISGTFSLYGYAQ